MIRWTPEEQYRAVSAADGPVIQARPFRDFIDAVRNRETAELLLGPSGETLPCRP